MARRGGRIGAAAIDAFAVSACATVVLAVAGSTERPYAAVFLVALTWWAYETATVALGGATLGQRAVNLRVAALDHAGRPSWSAAARRAAVDAALGAAVVVGWAFWLGGVLGDPLGRGPADRAAGTMVVPRTAVAVIGSRDLPGYADGARPPKLTTLGRVADADVRVRARIRRVVDAPGLAATAGMLALASTLFGGSIRLFVASFAVWVAAFTVDETRRLVRHGATYGHRAGGLVVLDRRTGQPPGSGRAVARAVVLGLILYVPVLWPLLLITVAMMAWSATGRGLHDLAGASIVVADPRLDAEEQRQRAMALRLGRDA